MGTLARSTSLLVLAAAAGATLFAACDERMVYVYTAARYNAADDCMEEYGSIELVPGEGVSARCSPRCLGFEGEVYVSTVCPPLPDGVEELPPGSAECVAALAAHAREASCVVDDDAPEAGAGGDAEAPDDGGPSEGGSTPVTPDADPPTPIVDASTD